MLSFLSRNWKEKEGDRVIVLNKVLPSEINVGYHDLYEEIVVSVNGKRPLNMKDLISIIEKSDTDYVDIVCASSDRIVLKKQDVRQQQTPS